VAGGLASDFHKNKKQIDNKEVEKHVNEETLRSDTETLSDIIKTRAVDFNHVNVTTALHRALESPWSTVCLETHGYPRGVCFEERVHL
jgi:hypothetical protein